MRRLEKNIHQQRPFMRKLIFLTLIILLSAMPAAADDPPGLSAYKTKVEAAIADSCAAVAGMWPNRPTTLNLSAAYYDGLKVTTELNELYGSTTWYGGIETCRSQLFDIISARYIATAGQEAGYTRFPHGLAKWYIETGSATALSAFDEIRDGTNWSSVNRANEQIKFSREVAYALETYTYAKLLGRPHENQTAVMNHFLDMALSHLNQWTTGNFYDAGGGNNYLHSFMVGLTMNALIQYYELIDKDTRIPPAIKGTIDLLWDQAWWPNVRDPEPSTLGDASSYAGYDPEGAFWYWMNWNAVDQKYEPEPNKLPSSADVNADTNMLIGPAYMWYALYSGDSTYRTKALDVWDGMVANAWFGNDGRHQWAASRYVSDFIRWYRQDTGSVCGAATLDLCTAPSSCATAGGNWNGIGCQYLPVVATYVSVRPQAPLNLQVE